MYRGNLLTRKVIYRRIFGTGYVTQSAPNLSDNMVDVADGASRRASPANSFYPLSNFFKFMRWYALIISEKGALDSFLFYSTLVVVFKFWYTLIYTFFLTFILLCIYLEIFALSSHREYVKRDNIFMCDNDRNVILINK